MPRCKVQISKNTKQTLANHKIRPMVLKIWLQKRFQMIARKMWKLRPPLLAQKIPRLLKSRKQTIYLLLVTMVPKHRHLMKPKIMAKRIKMI